MEILERFKPKRTIDNPSEEELWKWSLARGGRITEFGNLSVITQVRHRIAKFTEVIMNEPSQENQDFINRVLDYLQNKEVIQLDRTMCQNPEFKTPSRLYVTADYPRLPLMWGSTLFPAEKQDPEFVTIAVPEWKEQKTLVFPKEGLTLTTGTDYKGECKKAMLRQLMYKAKLKGCLGCHAGSKIIRLKIKDHLRDFGVLFFGLSGTGKTSLTCHHHWLKYPEKVIIRQDDVVILTPNRRAIGTEASYYVKTDKLDSATQPLLYAAAISPRAILENVKVDQEGKVDFSDTTLTSNGRAMVRRSDVAFTDGEIDLPQVDFIFFITRRYDIMPPIIKLSPEWAALSFMLGESVETSAGDPAEAGRSLRVVGTNPFIVGSAAEEGNIFLKTLRDNPEIQCFILNTGSVGGEKGQKISLPDTVKIIEMVIKDKIRWQKDEFWGYQVPIEIPGIDMDRFEVKKYYPADEIKLRSQTLKSERLEWLSHFEKEGLNLQIVRVLNPEAGL